MNPIFATIVFCGLLAGSSIGSEENVGDLLRSRVEQEVISGREELLSRLEAVRSAANLFVDAKIRVNLMEAVSSMVEMEGIAQRQARQDEEDEDEENVTELPSLIPQLQGLLKAIFQTPQSASTIAPVAVAQSVPVASQPASQNLVVPQPAPIRVPVRVARQIDFKGMHPLKIVDGLEAIWKNFGVQNTTSSKNTTSTKSSTTYAKAGSPTTESADGFDDDWTPKPSRLSTAVKGATTAVKGTTSHFQALRKGVPDLFQGAREAYKFLEHLNGFLDSWEARLQPIPDLDD